MVVSGWRIWVEADLDDGDKLAFEITGIPNLPRIGESIGLPYSANVEDLYEVAMVDYYWNEKMILLRIKEAFNPDDRDYLLAVGWISYDGESMQGS